MFICNKDKQQFYINDMEKLKAENRANREKQQRLILQDWNQHIQKKSFLRLVRNRLTSLNSTNRSTDDYQASSTIQPWKKLSTANYFSTQRIAVYTCIVGAYDKLTEPLLKPDNIDYYVITDQLLSPHSKWCFLDISQLKERLLSLTAIEQNRWYKMHSHLLFPDYDYSVYLDGNVTPVTDLTEFIHRIGACGIATHSHYSRKCVYQEAHAVLQSGKSLPEHIKKHQSFLQKQSMPKDYGLADCSVIARKHHETVCIDLMEQWWKEFLAHSRRDQLSFPYVMFKNNLSMADITTLGSNRIFNDALIITPHTHELKEE